MAIGKLVYMLATAREDNTDKLFSLSQTLRDHYCNFSEEVFE